MERNVKLVAILAALMLIFGVVNETFAQSEKVPYAVFNDSTLTFYYGNNKPVGAYGMRDTTNDGKNEWYSVCKEIKTVVFDESFRNYRPTSCVCWFYGCSSLTEIVGMRENLNTSDVTTMEFMFSKCKSLTNLDVSKFNTAHVTNMSEMFLYCYNLMSLDVSKFNTTNVVDMSGMFCGCVNLTSLDVSNFNTAAVTDMSLMFAKCTSITSLDVSKFNTTNVVNMSGMFGGCESLTSLDVSKFNTAKVTDMSWMFYECRNLTRC